MNWEVFFGVLGIFGSVIVIVYGLGVTIVEGKKWGPAALAAGILIAAFTFGLLA